jgi:ferritin-like metal-binding protein YciE
MSEAREWLIQWLRDAHAMEEQAETILSGQFEPAGELSGAE